MISFQLHLCTLCSNLPAANPLQTTFQNPIGSFQNHDSTTFQMQFYILCSSRPVTNPLQTTFQKLNRFVSDSSLVAFPAFQLAVVAEETHSSLNITKYYLNRLIASRKC